LTTPIQATKIYNAITIEETLFCPVITSSSEKREKKVEREIENQEIEN